MKILKVNLKNCYGINELITEFDFSQKRTYVMYAPNGVMKTSFAKTFKDLSNKQESKDLVFPHRKTERNIKDENDSDIKPEQIFVIEPYNEQFNSDKLSTLLVSLELKKEYDNAYNELGVEKTNFITKLKNLSQSTDCEYEFVSTFATQDQNSFFELLSSIATRLDGNQVKYDFKYNAIFDKKGNVKKFLTKHQDSLELYVQKYESLISQSSFFKKSNNTFGTYQASEILSSVSDNSFFEAGHSLELTNSTKIKSANELKTLLEEEIKKVLNDEKLQKLFDKVDKAIGLNVELRAFKSVIEKNNLLLVELQDYEAFKKKTWMGYLDKLNSEVISLVSFYNSRKKQIEKVILKARKEKTDWEKSIEEFNGRFKGLPFRLSMKNKEDVMLKTSAPSVEFVFHNNGDERVIERNELLAILSQGERRALYLLNIIFEVQARRKANQETIFIIDDIADSFDYKNKYAIVEYINDIQKDRNSYQLILTHNYDFFRCISGRIIGNGGNERKYKINVVKTDREIKLLQEKYQNNPFIHWKDHLDNNYMLIASIPFVRNLAEYSGYTSECEKLTSLLHIKTDTNTIKIEDLEDVFKTILKDKSGLSLTNGAKKVIELIFKSADSNCNITDEFLNLENKIVLSIAIRLKAEEFMIKAINDQSFVDNISANQTIELISKYKELFPTSTTEIELLEQVNLMTPENIHLNSFMYEPILDLGDKHLKDLYKNIKILATTKNTI